MEFTTSNDHMQIGDIVPLENGWFLDTTTNRRFTLNEEGLPVDKDGNLLVDPQEWETDE